VVLTEDLPHVGQTGQLVRVRPGYARNFLIPRGLAVLATRDNVARVEHDRRVAELRAAKLRAEAEQTAVELGKVSVSIARAVGEEDKLYGSVTSRDIFEALAEKGIDVDRRKIVTEPIKELGTHPVQIKIASGVDATIQVEVVAKAEG